MLEKAKQGDEIALQQVLEHLEPYYEIFSQLRQKILFKK
ncbi:helix-turn-helix domain-containing protein [Brevibacillus laterosporus]